MSPAAKRSDNAEPRPNDDQIVEAVKAWNGSAATYVIANRLFGNGRKCGTDWLLRQLRRLEADKRVMRAPGVYARQITWTTPPETQP